MNDTLMELRDFLQERLSGINGEEIKNETKLKEDLGFDSLRLVDVMVSVEEQFNIIFDDSDLDPSSLIRIGDLVNLIEKTKRNALQ